jgi:hypothetical protein
VFWPNLLSGNSDLARQPFSVLQAWYLGTGVSEKLVAGIVVSTAAMTSNLSFILKLKLLIKI